MVGRLLQRTTPHLTTPHHRLDHNTDGVFSLFCGCGNKVFRCLPRSLSRGLVLIVVYLAGVVPHLSPVRRWLVAGITATATAAAAVTATGCDTGCAVKGFRVILVPAGPGTNAALCVWACGRKKCARTSDGVDPYTHRTRTDETYWSYASYTPASGLSEFKNVAYLPKTKQRTNERTNEQTNEPTNQPTQQWVGTNTKPVDQHDAVVDDDDDDENDGSARARKTQ